MPEIGVHFEEVLAASTALRIKIMKSNSMAHLALVVLCGAVCAVRRRDP